MKDRLNFELLNREDGGKISKKEEKNKRTVLDVDASEGELMWTCSLILIAYAGIGVILTGRLILDMLSYLGWNF